ncbi:MAG: topoisomerase [Acidobacteriota bacterium]|jgi:DNA topoisomerase-1
MRRAPRGERANSTTAVEPVLDSTRPDPEDSAKAAGLRYTVDTAPGIQRVRHGSGFRYIGPDGKVVRSSAELQRIRSLVIPPAWTQVWISTDPRGHLQATGRDARGRKQYRYHPRWREVRDDTKYHRMIAFAQALATIRRRTAQDLAGPRLSKEKVLAAVVQLLEKTLIRVGNDEYAKQNRSFGLTTMRDGHVEVNGGRVRFAFRGKSGVGHEIDLTDRRLARIVKACRDIPGYDLFQYYDENGERQSIGSADVNAYLQEITGKDFTSKDFRTWAGTVLAAQLLRDFEQFESDAQAKRNIVQAVESVAKRLGNTKAVCRKCYIHPAIFDSYLDGSMLKTVAQRARKAARKIEDLSEGEAAVLGLLERRLAKETRRRAS